MAKTAPLRNEIKQCFFPIVQERGFIVDLREPRFFWVFRRWANQQVHIFEIQWDKYGMARFRINYGTCNSNGEMIGTKFMTPENIFASWLPDSGHLQPRKGRFSSRKWFRQDNTLFQRLFGKPKLCSTKEVVDNLLKLFFELEHYWSTGNIGKHMQKIPS